MPESSDQLRGSAPEGLWGFEDSGGNRLNGGEATIPILEKLDSNRYKFIATETGKRGHCTFLEANPSYSCFGARCPVVHIEREPEAITWSIVFSVATFSWLSIATLRFSNRVPVFQHLNRYVLR